MQIAKLASRNKRFAAIDRAISRNGLKFVTLLRLSPLLPLAVSNYLYGLTSVDLGSYVLGSWLGMLPGEVVILSVCCCQLLLAYAQAVRVVGILLWLPYSDCTCISMWPTEARYCVCVCLEV